MKLDHELFDKKRHNRTHFDCGVSKINTFLQRQISQDIKKNLCKAYVLHEQGEIAAFYTVSPASLQYKVLGTPYDSTDGYRIGWLAVDKKYQGKGLGEKVTLFAMSRCFSASVFVGGKLVYVDAIDDKAKRFYESIGFQALPTQPHCLYFLLSDFEQLLQRQSVEYD